MTANFMMTILDGRPVVFANTAINEKDMVLLCRKALYDLSNAVILTRTTECHASHSSVYKFRVYRAPAPPYGEI